MTASSCDEYVWALLSAAQTRGVRLTPALLPQKHKIVIYSHSEPETIVLNGDGSGGGGEYDDPAEEGRTSEGGDAGAGGNSSGPTSTSPDSWSSSSLSSVAGDGEGQEEEGEGGVGSSNSTDSGSGVSGGVQEGQGGEEGAGDDDRRRRRRQRGRTLLWGSSLRRPLDRANSTPAPGAASAASSGEDIIHVEPASDASDLGDGVGGGGAREMETAGVEGEVTLQPTISSTEVSFVEGAPGETPAPVSVLDDWEQVVAYYQSLQLCLQEVSYVQ